LKTPEVAEGSASPAVEATLYREDAVQFSGGEGNGDAPEEGHEGEEDEGHARAGVAVDIFEAEGAAGGVAVKNGEKGKETDLAEA
jgi:hypothetical protein